MDRSVSVKYPVYIKKIAAKIYMYIQIRDIKKPMYFPH